MPVEPKVHHIHQLMGPPGNLICSLEQTFFAVRLFPPFLGLEFFFLLNPWYDFRYMTSTCTDQQNSPMLAKISSLSTRHSFGNKRIMLIGIAQKSISLDIMSSLPSSCEK